MAMAQAMARAMAHPVAYPMAHPKFCFLPIMKKKNNYIRAQGFEQ